MPRKRTRSAALHLGTATASIPATASISTTPTVEGPGEQCHASQTTREAITNVTQLPPSDEDDDDHTRVHGQDAHDSACSGIPTHAVTTPEHRVPVKLGRKIDQGSFGNVYLAWIGSKRVTVKRIVVDSDFAQLVGTQERNERGRARNTPTCTQVLSRVSSQAD